MGIGGREAPGRRCSCNHQILSPAATGLMAALNPLAAGVGLKPEASNTAEIDSRATESATWSAQARVELFCCFFIELFLLNQFSCRFFLSPPPHRRFAVTLSKVKISRETVSLVFIAFVRVPPETLRTVNRILKQIPRKNLRKLQIPSRNS
jgi:hypothetical protein